MSTITPALVSKKTSELRLGDLVRLHGMRLRITEEPVVAIGHHMNEQADRLGEVRFTHAILENVDDPDVDDFVRRHLDRRDGFLTWTIQGNDLARWTVEAPLHLMTGSSSVRCGARMAPRAGDPGWTLADVTVNPAAVTCPKCQ